ncbi:neurogenic locus Notch -like isoform X1 [Paramuricea clavata]|uniref:Neurogenic locus Notch -like isoform X1 n=1 Tax=Paramuricea clavata TaxID=317549 RepID=A0A6S7IRC4_PARCT|nr:neurogenic locus Notch -like isoform X1 [Paramuricea clavata]
MQVNACHRVLTEILISFLSHAVTCADHPCEHDGVCIDDDVSYSCSCGAGYSGSNCEIIELPCGQDIFTDLDLKDQCASNKCPSQQKCMMDTDGNALCFCKPGLSGDDCSDQVTRCEQVVCLHDGKCIDENGKFHCNCVAEYKGANCENRVSGEILYPPHKKYFCPVVQTIGERGKTYKVIFVFIMRNV